MAINRDKVHAAAAKLLQQGKFDKAVAELVKLVEDDPTDVRTLLKLGETYPKMGKKKEALDAFEKAANIYTEQGFYLKAVAVLKQLLRVDANVPEMHMKLAELYQQLGLTSDALQHYQHVAVFHEQAGRARETLDILKRMVDLDPDNLPSRIKLGELFASQGLQAEAVQELRGALNFLKNQQRFDDYVRVGEKLVAYDAGALDVAKELATVYLQRKEPSLALSKLQIVFKSDSRSVETLTLMAQAFLDMQQVGKTVLVYKELAKIHAADGNAAAAAGQWEQVLALAPGDPEAESALGRASAAPAAFAPTQRSPAAPAAAPTMVPQPSTGGGLPPVPPSSAAAAAPAAPAAAAAPAAPRPSGGGDAAVIEQLNRLMTETDVYVKYGLKDKASEHLKKVFALKADHIPGLEKQKQLLQAVGGRELKDALRKLVLAADEQEHPRLAEWKAELQHTDNKRNPSAGISSPPTSLSGVPTTGSGAAPVQPFVTPAGRPPPVREPTIVQPSSLAASRSSELFVVESVEGAVPPDLDDSPIEDPSGVLRLDPSRPDEPFLPDEISSLPDLPPDVAGGDAFGAGALGADAFDDAALAEAITLPPDQPEPSSPGRQVPRMPTGVVAKPVPDAVLARPAPLPLAHPTAPAPPLVLEEEELIEAPAELDASDADPDELVRAALRDISQEDLAVAADELLLEAQPESPLDFDGSGATAELPSEPMLQPARTKAPAPSPLQNALVAAGSDEQDALAAVEQAFDTAPRGTQLSRGTQPGAAQVTQQGRVDIASTALMGLSPDELDEIREFEGDTNAPTGGKSPAKPAPSAPKPLPPEMLAADDFGFAEATQSRLATGASSDVPTGESPRKRAASASGNTDPGPPPLHSSEPERQMTVAVAAYQNAPFRAPPTTDPSMNASRPSGSFAEPSGEFDPNEFELPDDVKAMLGEPSAPSAAPAAPAAPVEDEGLAAKLGTTAKGQGFETDPANQFFPDEIEEAEFFIQQELLDEARDLLNNILEDVPESPRAQWMLARVDAEEAGQPEPPAPWEQRILDEVAEQLEGLDLPEAEPLEAAAGERQVSVEEVLSAFKKGIAETVPEDDAVTHYDLGCAYRDMGLLDEAVAEFRIAARAPSKAADARYLIGVTRADQGNHNDAVAALEEALAVPNTTRDQRAASHYQLGVSLEALNKLQDAQRAFKQAKAIGHAAVDLDRRIAALVAKVGEVELGANGNGHGHGAVKPSGGGTGKTKNIDYV